MTGRLFGHGPGTGEEVEVRVSGASVIAVAAGRMFEFTLASSKLELGGSRDEKLVIERSDASGTLVLYCDHASMVAELRRLGADGELAPRLDALERRRSGRARRWLAAGLLLAVGLAAVAFLVFVLVGAAVRYGLSKVPIAWEVELGRSLMSSLSTSERKVVDPALLAPVDAVFQRLVAATGETGYAFKLDVVRSDEVNAFALPGGAIAVHTGLIAKCRAPEELAGVLAHEIQHVRRRHSLQALGEHLKWRIALGLVIGDLGAVQDAALAHATELQQLAHSRDAEREADEGGLDLLLAAGVDPEGMVSFFETLAAERDARSSIPTFLSTHPGSADRSRRLRELIAGRSRGESRPLEVDWSDLQARLKTLDRSP